LNRTVQEITQLVESQSPTIKQLTGEISKVIVGQRQLIERLLIGLLGNGHILVEGVPGLAKTTAVKCLSDAIHCKFNRIQFTPDLLPSDLIGTQVYSPRDEKFTVKKGPLFTNLVLADEINRAPAKVQSALLEAMQERQITIGDETFPLPEPFLVMATQNPIEQEGTYPLPEAQVDRFMLKVRVTYPSKEEEIEIMKRSLSTVANLQEKIINPEKIIEMRNIVKEIFIDEKLFQYIADLVFATRTPSLYDLDDIKNFIEYGASPRASINLVMASKVHAFLQGRGYVTPQDIKSVGLDVMRHRLIISYEAEAQNLTSDDILLKIFDRVNVP